ncbi:MAG: hypothetical protein K0R19_2645 [Bacillota bacterium]|jgi:hypothetical protein|nr:hypothetical protein [Bacillota bacterium]
MELTHFAVFLENTRGKRMDTKNVYEERRK